MSVGVFQNGRLQMPSTATENSKKIFPEMKPHGLSPYSYIFYVSASYLFIPTVGLSILLQEK
jgi:hypothetical protein